MERILVIEDEESIRIALEDDLKFEGYQVISAKDGKEGLALALEAGCDLIILDIMLPEIDGFEVCRRLRQSSCDTPVIMLTAKNQEIDKVVGLELGADDYISKPFSPRELIARIKAILRRIRRSNEPKGFIQFGDVQVDFKGCEVRKSKQSVYLTSLEFSLLEYFIQNKGIVLDRSTILDHVWGKEVYVLPKTVDTHVGHLRKKIETDPANPVHLVSVHGKGYKFIT